MKKISLIALAIVLLQMLVALYARADENVLCDNEASDQDSDYRREVVADKQVQEDEICHVYFVTRD